MPPNGMTIRHLTTLFVIGTIVLTGPSCRRTTDPAPSATEDLRADKVILITLDTLRADHLGCYGYPRQTSPTLDSMAANGVIFMNAVSQMATTVPSHASIFTGLYPLEHGVRKNGQVLPQGVTPLAESLTATGIRTAAFVATGHHFGAAGLGRGFDHFDEPALEGVEYRNAAGTIAPALEYIARQPADGKAFVWVHMFDTHTPYSAENRYEAAPAERTKLTDFYQRVHRVPLGFYDDRPEALIDTMELYDGEIRAMDRAIGALTQVLREKDGWTNALVIVTADHGEGLGNHFWHLHGKHIYNEQVRVPLIVYSVSHDVPHRKIDEVVEIRDLYSTIASLLGVPVSVGAPLAHSIRSLLQGQRASTEVYAFTERREFAARESDAADENYEPGEKFAIQDAAHKYILRTDGREELYDLRSDPYETSNIAGTRLGAEEALRKRLRSLVASLMTRRKTPGTVSQETIDQLRALGYVQ